MPNEGGTHQQDVRPGKISVVVPVFNETENIDRLALEIDRAMEPTGWDWECVWVDDGSTDGTTGTLEKLNKRAARHQYVHLANNCGQSGALAVGFSHATGDLIATIDGDGQNDPGEIPKLVEILVRGRLDMATGIRANRYRRVHYFASRIANAFRNRITGDDICDVGCSLRVFRSDCVRNLFVFDGMHRFLPTLVRQAGFHGIVQVPVKHLPRIHGRSKYGIWDRLWVGIADTLAVHWMARRAVTPLVGSTSVSRDNALRVVHDDR